MNDPYLMDILQFLLKIFFFPWEWYCIIPLNLQKIFPLDFF